MKLLKKTLNLLKKNKSLSVIKVMEGIIQQKTEESNETWIQSHIAEINNYYLLIYKRFTEKRIGYESHDDLIRELKKVVSKYVSSKFYERWTESGHSIVIIKNKDSVQILDSLFDVYNEYWKHKRKDLKNIKITDIPYQRILKEIISFLKIPKSFKIHLINSNDNFFIDYNATDCRHYSLNAILKYVKHLNYTQNTELLYSQICTNNESIIIR
jgi:hypothetical protein